MKITGQTPDVAYVMAVNWPTECAVIIPCLNEAQSIFPLVKNVSAILPHVIVVDDGSRDTTGQRAAEAGAEVLSHRQTRGKGAALDRGFRRAAARGFPWALMMDGDGQHAVGDIPALLGAAESGADLVVGNRMADPRQMPRLRRMVNAWMSRRLSRDAGQWLPDSQCGFRLVRLEAWATLSLQTSHFEIESEMLLGFIARHYSVKFIPVQAIYRGETSKINPWRDTWRWFQWRWETRRAGPRQKLAQELLRA